jgi:hypothetical protein
MPLIPLQIPPGVIRNGTDLESANRWRDVSLVRWRNGSLRPVGGWRERKADAFTSITRGMHAWQDNSGNRWVAAGSASALYVMSAANISTDITPATLASGNVDPTLNLGYGGGFYGLGFYGAPPLNSGIYAEATSWSLDNWGEYLVACNPQDGTIWEWQLNVASDAAAIANAPTDNLGIVVTEERFLFALGAGGNPRKVQWCDREDNTLWTPAATNEAGDILLQTSGQIMAGVRTRGQTLILTDQDAHSATYQGPPFVYGFERVGTACGLIARKAAVAVDSGVFWMGRNAFHFYDGSSVRELNCLVQDHVFGDINNTHISKAWAMSLGNEGEIWWFYPSSGSTECDRYVIYDYKADWWAIGELSRTSGIDRGVFQLPMMMDAGNELYEHEVGINYGGASIYAETGPISLGAGDQVMNVTHLIPDEFTQGQVTATFKTRFYPNDTERSYGPYTMANPTSVRFTGRQIRMRINGTASDWRVGVMRIDAKARGLR